MEIEKYTPFRINKDVDPSAIHRSGDRKFLPGDILDALNCQYINGKKRGKLKSTRGNVFHELSFGGISLPSEIKTIGSCINERDNTVIYFIRKQLADFIVEWDPATDVFDVLLSADLKFSTSHYITAGCIDGILIWNDGFNPPRKMIIDRARAGGYNGIAFEWEISLAAYAPIIPPTVARISNFTIDYNYVTNNIFQFSYRFIYLDNTYSAPAPASIAVAGITHHDGTITNDNGIDVSFPADTRRNAMLKAIEFLYRTPGGVWNIYKTLTAPFPTVTITAQFFNDGKSIPLSAADNKNVFDSIPSRTDALAIADNRVFFPLNKTGFDVGGDFVFNAESAFDVGNESDFRNDTTSRDLKYFKDGGLYGIGIVFFDQYDKPSFVRKEKYIQFPAMTAISGGGYDGGCQIAQKRKITWSIVGTAPPGMKRYSIVITREQNYIAYQQCIARPYRYIRDLGVNEEDNVMLFTGSGSQDPNLYNFRWKGKEFANVKSGDPTKTESIYLQVPVNLSFVPEVGDLVKILSGNVYRAYPIRGIFGDWLDVGKVDHLMSGDLTIDNKKNIFIEIYRPKTVRDEEFFEIGPSMNILGQTTFQTTSGTVKGPVHSVVFDQSEVSDYKFYYNYIPVLPDMTGDDMPTAVDLGDKLEDRIRVESPTNIVEGVSVKLEGSNVGQNLFNAEAAGFLTKFVFTLNYAKPDGDYGRVHTTNVFEKQFNLNTVIGYSDPYVQGTTFNGLSTVPAENAYTLPVERSDVSSLVKVGDNLVAIHERGVSTLYLRRGVLKQGADFLTAKVEGVVGDDNELLADNGTINPESVKVIDKRVYWWDAINGAVCRYTNAGVYEISKNGMQQYFFEKGKIYWPYRTQVKIVSGYDPMTDEFLITFPAIEGVIAAETWAFDITEEVWTTRYSFIPDNYANINLDLITWKEGHFWLHNNPVFNNFYGVQYKRSWRFAMNAHPGKNKRYLNVHIDGPITTTLNSEEKIVQIFTTEGQESFIPAYEFELDEFEYFASVLKNINTPVENGKLALRSGDDMVSKYAEIEIINDRIDEAASAYVNVVFKIEEFSV